MNIKITKNIIIICAILFVPIIAEADCLLLMENDRLITSEGDCATRYAPCSTFKIALSLIGYNEGLLIDETHPELAFKTGYPDYISTWKQNQNPRSWMKNSCVWYSQVLTRDLGEDKFKQYITNFNYGNQDVSGDVGKDNGLTNSWLSSSLEISPEEQLQFLNRLHKNDLPVSLRALQLTKKIMYVEDLPNGWKLYGKTGNGNLLSADRGSKLDLQIGWFIGWIEKDKRTILFVHFIQDKEKQTNYASLRAKAAVIKLLSAE